MAVSVGWGVSVAVEVGAAVSVGVGVAVGVRGTLPSQIHLQSASGTIWPDSQDTVVHSPACPSSFKSHASPIAGTLPQTA